MGKVLISMPDKFIADIDKVANEEDRSRSELIREALRTYITRKAIIDRAKANNNAKILSNMLS